MVVEMGITAGLLLPALCTCGLFCWLGWVVLKGAVHSCFSRRDGRLVLDVCHGLTMVEVEGFIERKWQWLRSGSTVGGKWASKDHVGR